MPRSDAASDQAVLSPRRRLIAPVASWSIGAIAVTTLFAIGAWQRRWIADDGLIVLRTVRNLLAGNGPVFNAGERVEANTSTLWTYVVWFFSWITGAEHTEYVALWVALLLSVAAIPLAMYGTARLYGRRVTGRGVGLLLPFGAIIYIAVPPARDFATSGLENGLTIFWVAALWCQFLAWARRRDAEPTRRSRAAFLALAFTAGLAPLVRPEGAVLGVLVLIVLISSPIGWRMRIAMTAVAGALPVAYQIFRMGYYAVLVPNPAIAKDASGSKWSQGFAYLGNLFSPYTLILPVILAVVVGIVLAVVARADRTAPDAPHDEPADLASGRERIAAWWTRWSLAMQSQRTVVITMLVAGAILTVYWLRQGGDFMHGRVLLTPMFILLLPVMVVPAVLPDTVRTRSGRLRLAAAIGVFAAWGATVWWGVVAHEKVISSSPLLISRDGIVDERRFYVANLANENPITAVDYLDFPRMRSLIERVDEVRPTGGVVLPPDDLGGSDYDSWAVVHLQQPLPEGARREVTVYMINLGMTSMNLPLDVRVVDDVGLAYPPAAHTGRLQDGRIGHDKDLPSSWVVAESGGVDTEGGLPAFISPREVKLAQTALTCPDTVSRLESYKDGWSFSRFRQNLAGSVGFSSYRIARQPEYEIQRCGLPMPAGLDEK